MSTTLTEMSGDKIRRCREAKGWSQAELADQSGLTPSIVCRLESGLRQPLLSTASAIATALGVSIDDLTCRRRIPQNR